MKLVALHNIDVRGRPSVQSSDEARQQRSARLTAILAEYQSRGMSYDLAWAVAQREHQDIFAAMEKPANGDSKSIARGNF